jgi:uncharacterized membrane protein
MSDDNKKVPIFIRKESGLGWYPNSKRPISYFILAGIIAVIIVVELFVCGKIKI